MEKAPWDRGLAAEEPSGYPDHGEARREPGCKWPCSTLLPSGASHWPRQPEAREQESLRDEPIDVTPKTQRRAEHATSRGRSGQQSKHPRASFPEVCVLGDCVEGKKTFAPRMVSAVRRDSQLYLQELWFT